MFTDRETGIHTDSRVRQTNIYQYSIGVMINGNYNKHVEFIIIVWTCLGLLQNVLTI